MLAAAWLCSLAVAPPETGPPRHTLPSAVDVAREPVPDRGHGQRPAALPPAARTPTPAVGGVTPLGVPHARTYTMPPPTGAGLLGGGVGLLALGGFSLTTGLLVLGEPRAGAPVSPAITLSLGALTVAGGATSLVYGVKRRRRYRGWLGQHHLPFRASGLGLITGGGATTAIGALGVGLTFAEVDTKDGDPLTAPLYFVFGGAAVAGVVMAGVGWARHRSYDAWLAGLPIEWTPYVAPTRAGTSLGLAGRF